MDVRKYEALTMQDAVKLIKKELGPDAVILSTREKEKENPNGKTKTKIVEVIAAAAVTSSSLKNPKIEKSVQPVIFPTLNRNSDVQIVRGSPAFGTVHHAPKIKVTNDTFAEKMKAINNIPATQAVPSKQIMSSREVMESSAAATQDVLGIRAELSKVRREIEALPSVNVNSEMQEIKILLHDLMKQRYRGQEQTQYPDNLTNIAIKMRAAGVLESVLSDFVDAITACPVPKNPDNSAINSDKLKEFYLNGFIRQIFKNLQVTGALLKSGHGQKINCLVGPTGVGKTTTIAKLATAVKMQQKAKVALLSLDAFRIAGSSQLRTYAKILDIPFAEINDLSEIVSVLQKWHDIDYIFIDTAGKVVRDAPHIEGIKSLKNIDAPINFHLVLSSTMKQRDIDETVRGFLPLGIDSLIFTKLDESWNFGEILNTAVKSKLPLSYFAIGQRVPEDIEIATKEKIVERLFQL